ncbi:MBL fold metallo-hydrolase [uncultured Bacteroides sp.]|uniref:MBL fold metallo-hydrolase n=1 Tax=uncultured Bacteroides sp. TaxID=162156 RepID=UPI00280B55ED|nr:MBL fold metallo-hydrolase [uncultured Bacteroides sp.]
MLVTQVVNRVLNSNTWLLTEDNFDAWLVDCGDVDLLQSVLQPNYTVKGVFITHSHFDHIYGLNNLLKIWPRCIVYTNEFGYEALLSDKKNFSRYYEVSFIFEYPENICLLSDEKTVLLYNNVVMSNFSTPGHDPSCICYECCGNLFTGDAYIPDTKPVTNLRGGNKEEYQKSLTLIKERMNSCSFLFPGHGKSFCVNYKF